MSNNVAKWHEALEARNADVIEGLLSDSPVFYSPVVFTPQVGKEITTVYLTAAFHVLLNDTFHYVKETNSDDCSCLEFEVTIDGKIVNGMDIISWDSDGKICEFKVMLRPLQGVNLIHQKMGEMLASLK